MDALDDRVAHLAQAVRLDRDEDVLRPREVGDEPEPWISHLPQLGDRGLNRPRMKTYASMVDPLERSDGPSSHRPAQRASRGRARIPPCLFDVDELGREVYPSTSAGPAGALAQNARCVATVDALVIFVCTTWTAVLSFRLGTR